MILTWTPDPLSVCCSRTWAGSRADRRPASYPLRLPSQLHCGEGSARQGVSVVSTVRLRRITRYVNPGDISNRSRLTLCSPAGRCETPQRSILAPPSLPEYIPRTLSWRPVSRPRAGSVGGERTSRQDTTHTPSRCLGPRRQPSLRTSQYQSHYPSDRAHRPPQARLRPARPPRRPPTRTDRPARRSPRPTETAPHRSTR